MRLSAPQRDAYVPRLEAHRNAAAEHEAAALAYADRVWRRAEALAQLDERQVIDLKDVKLAVQELNARQGEYVFGALGGLLLGAAFGAVLGWLPELGKVKEWHWGTVVVVGLVGSLSLWVSRRAR